MGADSSAPTVRATVVQASTVFYDTPATLGSPTCVFCFLHSHYLTECYYSFEPEILLGFYCVACFT
jgi:hypothetical protein